jgi:hypothetical protein
MLIAFVLFRRVVSFEARLGRFLAAGSENVRDSLDLARESFEIFFLRF